MIEKIFDKITFIIKEKFPDCNVWKSPVTTSYKDDDFLVSLKSSTISPKTSGYLMHSLCFSITRMSSNFNYDNSIDLEQLVDIISLDNGITLKALVTKNEIKDKKYTMELIYSFYSHQSQNTNLMEELSCE